MDRKAINKLIKKHEVVEEINRHKWIESEKVGYDIGFEKAAEDWIKKFSNTWLKHHLPRQYAPSKTSLKRKTHKKGRSAKSYT